MRDTIHVLSVTSRRTAAGEKFDVAAKAKPGEKWGPVYATFDAWLASLAERAQALGVPLDIEWSQSAYNRELRTVRLADRGQTEVA